MSKKVFDNKQYQKDYYKNNKDNILKKLNTKYTCELCGGKYSYTGKNRHLSTVKHIKYIQYTSAPIETKDNTFNDTLHNSLIDFLNYKFGDDFKQKFKEFNNNTINQDINVN